MILITNRFINLAEKLVRNKEIEKIDKNELEMRLDEFEGLLSTSKLEVESSDNKLASTLLNQAQNLFEQSKNSFEANQLVFAKNTLELAVILQQRSMKLIK